MRALFVLAREKNGGAGANKCLKIWIFRKKELPLQKKHQEDSASRRAPTVVANGGKRM